MTQSAVKPNLAEAILALAQSINQLARTQAVAGLPEPAISDKSLDLRRAYEALGRGFVSRHQMSLIDNDMADRNDGLIDTSWDIPNGNYSSDFECIRPHGKWAQSAA